MKRPTYKELDHKIRCARSLVEKRRVAMVNQAALVSDAFELDYSISSELFEVLKELLQISRPEDYTGGRPPQWAYEQDISGLELLAFVVKIDRFSKAVYYKFALAEETLWLVSLHENRI